MKSPAMGEALKPLHRLEKAARKAHAEALAEHARDLDLSSSRSKRLATRRERRSRRLPASLPDICRTRSPKARRYVVNDTTYEALGEIMADNPNGVLAFRDELVSLLKGLDREEQSRRGIFPDRVERNSSYTFDRIIRGKTQIEGPASRCSDRRTGPARGIRAARGFGGAGDDGLIQRFGHRLAGPKRRLERMRPLTEHGRAGGRMATFDRLDGSTRKPSGRARPNRAVAVPALDDAQGKLAVTSRTRKTHPRGRNCAGAGKPSRQISQARSGARAHQPPCRWRSGANRRKRRSRALWRSRNTSKRTRAAPTAPDRERGRDGETGPGSHPQGRPSRRLRGERHSAQGMVRADRKRGNQGRARTARRLRLDCAGEDGNPGQAAHHVRDQSEGAPMTRYLAPLKASSPKTPLPDKLTKLTKGLLSVLSVTRIGVSLDEGHRGTGGPRRSRSARLSRRLGAAQSSNAAARVGRLLAAHPRRRRTLPRRLRKRSGQSGWTPGELFDPGDGLVWRLAGEHVRAIGADRAWSSDRSIVLRLQTRGFR